MALGQLLNFAPGFSAYAGGEEEARFYYQEIFIDHAYNVVELPEKAFIIDAGANIGFFTIYIKNKYPSSRILAFEPAPETFGDLGENLQLHAVNEGVVLHNCALGSQDTTQQFTFYPKFPGNSTLVPEEKELVVKTAYKRSSGSGAGSERMYQGAQHILVPVRRLSSFLHSDSEVKKIDLLKIDVEGAELETLLGLDDTDLALVQNMVIEICDLIDGNLERLQTFLHSKGFNFRIEMPDWSPPEGKMYMVIGYRSAAAGE